MTLAFNHSAGLFVPTKELEMPLICGGPSSLGLFCVATLDHLEAARAFAVAVLLVVASGWRPRWTGALHWWITFSFQANGTVLDGGDQVAAILTLILLPHTLTDSRAWHWQPSPPRYDTTRDTALRFIARSSLLVARIQVAAIYFHAAVGKLVVPEWPDGTVLYYWFTDPHLGGATWLMPVLRWIVDHGTLLTLVTWSVLAVEFALAAGLVVRSRYRPALLAAGITLHLGIMVIHGLFTFALTMIAALILYLHPSDRPFRLRLPRLEAPFHRSSNRFDSPSRSNATS
jgi:antimicrobial peptide system SdpB family protein